jgi:tetratricopeptide (TPR) repeat protein
VTSPEASPAASAASPQSALDDRALGLALFEAEECLARGNPDKAVVMASRVVKDRPDSLTARALLDRARRELLRGRRLERLEARIREASGLVESGRLEDAERIVISALKLIPDHTLALELFGRIKERRLGAGSAEAEALRELDRLARLQAQKALESAHAALAAGWERRAFFALHQGLRHAPGDPELLALLREAQKSLERLDAERARRRALGAQVRAGLDLLAQGQLDDSLRILRAVLREDPENARAQAAVQQVRSVWLTRLEFASATGRPLEVPDAAAAAPHAETLPGPVPPARAAPPQPPGAPGPAARATRTVRPPSAREEPAAHAGASRIPVELRLPATRLRSTPMTLVLACAALIVAIFAGLAFGGRASRGPSPPPLADPASAPSAAPQEPVPSREAPPAAAAPEAAGPWTGIPPELRGSVESRLTVYARALETADDELLAVARPDLSKDQRERALAPFRDALNAATDLRVLQVDVRGDVAEVVLLRSDFLVGRAPVPPTEERLRFKRAGSEWSLR